MARERPLLYSLNGGEVSPLALARVDLARMRLTAEEFYNFLPRTIGPMQLRAGFGYEDSVYQDAEARHLPFIFSVDDTALIELSDLYMRVIIDGETLTRVSVGASITSGDFDSSTGWTLTATSGAVCNINSTEAGRLILAAPARGSKATAVTSFAITGGQESTEHALRVNVARGTVQMRLGSTSGARDILGEYDLGPGEHSLAFTPGVATVYLQFSSSSETQVAVESVAIEAAGDVAFDTSWGAADLFQLRYQQSGDVIYVVHEDHQPMRIERRGTRSWSLVKYQPRIGPYRGRTADITLTPSVRTGNGTMTASAPFFETGHVGALFELTHTKTNAAIELAGADVYSDWVRISGRLYTSPPPNNRKVNRSASGTWAGTLTVLIANEENGPYLEDQSYTANFSATDQMGGDNEILYVKIGFQASEYSSGKAVIGLRTEGGGGTGVVRVTEYISPTVVKIEVVKRLHDASATRNWQEGKYSDFRGQPSAIELFEGRLWLGGKDQLSGSYSDDYTNFDVDEEGDAAPIIRSIATGPVNKVQWLLGLARLIIGTSGSEAVARSSSFDEPMSPANFSIKDGSNYGSADVQAVKVDRDGVFVQRAGTRLFNIAFSVESQDYTSQELTRFHPTLLEAGVKVLAVQRLPDTRVWMVLNDGTIAVLTLERDEDVIAFWRVETDGDFEDVTVLPNELDDDVYVIVKRTIDGNTVRYREKLAYDHEAQGGTLNKVADSFVVKSITNTALVTGLDHLEAKDVVVWVDSAPLLDADGEPQTFTVASGQITLPAAVTGTKSAIVGLPYEGRWQSTKLAYAAQGGSAVSQKKQVLQVSPVLYKTWNQALRFGQDFDSMVPLPRIIKGVDVGASALLDTLDYDAFSIPGSWSNDARICVKALAPMPATVLGMVFNVESHERS